MIIKFKLKWKKKNLIVFLQINLHINKTVISWKLMWEITRYIPVKDKTQLSKEYILPEFCIIDHWSEHPTPCSSLVNQHEIQYLKKKILYFITPQNIIYAWHCMYLKILLRIKTLLCMIESLLNWIEYLFRDVNMIWF